MSKTIVLRQLWVDCDYSSFDAVQPIVCQLLNGSVSLDNFILLDCGEGTLLQLHRQFGSSRAQQVLINLKAIYVSHLHADHHMGIINIVLERSKAFQRAGKEVEKLFIAGPSLISQYLSFYHHKFEPILTHLYQIQNQHLLYFHPQHRKVLKLDSFMLVSSLVKFLLRRQCCPRSNNWLWIKKLIVSCSII